MTDQEIQQLAKDLQRIEQQLVSFEQTKDASLLHWSMGALAMLRARLADQGYTG